MKLPGRQPAPRGLHATLQMPFAGEPHICRKCTGVFGAHFLTCPALRLPQPAARTEVTR